MTQHIEKLGDLCRIVTGGTPPRTRQDYFGSAVPWVKITDMLQGVVTRTEENLSESGLQNSSAKLLPAGTVLISIFATIGRTAILAIEAATNQAIAGVVVNDPATLDSRYLKLFLESQHPHLNRLARGVAQPNINQSILKNLDVPLVSMEAQLRIIDLLSRAEGIVRLRREAQAKAAEVLPALFLDMFGDPATNPKGLASRRVRDFVARFEGGKNLLASDEGSTPFRILRVSAVTSGRYVESESKPTPIRYEPPANHIVRVGDMLFSRANTQELVGATAIVDATNGRTLLPDKLWRFVWAEDVDQHYMHALFQNNYVREELGRLSSGTSASMRNISQEKLFGLGLPIAPLESQRAFGKHAEAMKSVLAQQEAAARSAESVFRSLLARVFTTGEQREAQDMAEAATA